jgi:hypothetical protein
MHLIMTIIDFAGLLEHVGAATLTAAIATHLGGTR